jgi:hypothetical protein
MADIPSLVERRWETNDDPKAHRPADMLRLAADRIDRGEIAGIEHAILVLGGVPANGEKGKRVRYLQAGQYDHFGQLGLIHSCANMLDA